MNDITTSLIVIVIVGLLVGLIFVLVAAQKRKKETALRNLASMNGWIFEPVEERLSSGWRLRKGDWKIEALNETSNTTSQNTGSSTVTSSTRWFTDTARMTDGVVLIGPHQPEINFGSISDMMMQAALRLMIGSEADVAAGIQRTELGSLELMARYMVWTNREEIAKKMLDQRLENALLAWPVKMPLVIKFSPAGLEVKIQSFRFYKEEDLYALVKLGNTLLDSVS